MVSSAGEKSPSPKTKSSSKCLIFLIILMVVGAILFMKLSKKDCQASSNTCKTPQCISLAHQMHNWADKKVDPCDDFFQFTCGKFVEQANAKHAIKWKQELTFNTLADYIVKLKEPKKKSEKAMKMVYEHCKKMEAEKPPEKFNGLDDESLKSLFSDIRKIGKWPMIDEDFSDKDFNINDYLEIISQVTTIPYFGLFDIHYFTVIAITPNLIDLTPFEKYNTTILKLFKMHNITINPEKFQQEFQEMLDFAQKLPTEKEIGDKKDELMETSPEELKARFKEIDFERILKKSMSPEQWEHFKKKLMVGVIPSNLDELIKATPPRVLANFLIIQTIINADEFLTGIADCSMNVQKYLPELTLGVIVHHYFDKRNLKTASGIVDEIQASFRKMFESSTWLQESTKKNALKKLEKMRKVVGYPEEFFDFETIEKKFEQEVDIQPSDSVYTFFGKLYYFQRRLTLDQAASNQATVSGIGWTITNAVYYAMDNTFMLTVPMMDDPLFDASFPKYAQIAAIGYIIGHEIGHGFDPKGSTFDEHGKQRDWWTSEDRKEYQKRAQCVIDKYENYDDPVYGKNLNGTKSIVENFADLLGAQASWDTYKKLDLSKEQKIVGFEDYSTDKLFFQMLASKWCAPTSTNSLEKQLTDGHGVNNYRVNGVFSNMKEFADTFNCPVGSKMNPAKKCPIF